MRVHYSAKKLKSKKSLKIPKGGNQNFKSKRDGQKKKYKRTNNDLQNTHIKLKIE